MTALPAIRDYTPADLAGCLAVFDSNVPGYFTAPEREEFRRFLTALPGPYLVLVDDDDAIVGCGGYAIVAAQSRADLCWGMVRSELHGTGLGRVLTVARLERATADPSVRVVALSTSQHTRGFYERLGFRTTEVVPNGIAPGLDRCEMRRDLEPGNGKRGGADGAG